jgi:hypothetical protein
MAPSYAAPVFTITTGDIFPIRFPEFSAIPLILPAEGPGGIS